MENGNIVFFLLENSFYFQSLEKDLKNEVDYCYFPSMESSEKMEMLNNERRELNLEKEKQKKSTIFWVALKFKFTRIYNDAFISKIDFSVFYKFKSLTQYDCKIKNTSSWSLLGATRVICNHSWIIRGTIWSCFLYSASYDRRTDSRRKKSSKRRREYLCWSLRWRRIWRHFPVSYTHLTLPTKA